MLTLSRYVFFDKYVSAPDFSKRRAAIERIFRWQPSHVLNSCLVGVICFPSARRHVAFRSDGFICRTPFPLPLISLLTAIPPYDRSRKLPQRGGGQEDGKRQIRSLLALLAMLTPSVNGIRLLASPRVYFAVTNNPLSRASLSLSLSAARCTGKMSTRASRTSALV